MLAVLERRLLSVRDGGKDAVARFEGIADRSAAEALRGSLVEVDRSALPPLDEGEYYHADLIGLPCVDRRRRSPSARLSRSRISAPATCSKSSGRTAASR